MCIHAPNVARFHALELIKYSWRINTMAQTTSICFWVPGSDTSSILLKFSLFSAQISDLGPIFIFIENR